MSKDSSSGVPGEPIGRDVLGVHLDVDSLRMVLVRRGRILRWQCLPYPDGLRPDTDDFPAFLKTHLDPMQPVFRRASLWVVGPLPSLQVRFLSLPRARPRQLASLVYWTFRKEIPFDAAQTVFDFDIEGEGGAGASPRRVDATACTVARADLEALAGPFERAGHAVDGVVIPSFALRNLFRVNPPPASGPVLGLNVGPDASALLFFKGRQVVAHRVFKTGMNVMLDVLRDRHPDLSAAAAYRLITEALNTAGLDQTAGGEAAQTASTAHIAFGRLVQQVERSMSAYLVGRSEEEIQAVHVAGCMAGLPGLVAELGSRLGLSSRPLDLFEPGRLDDKATPVSGPEEAGMMAMALGAALSEPARTPNLLQPHDKRMREARRKGWRLALAACGMLGLVLLLGAGGGIRQHNRVLRRELETCRARAHAYAPEPDRAMIEAMGAQAVRNQQELRIMAGRGLPLAALNQVALATPENIRLTRVVWERNASGTRPGKGPRTEAAALPELSVRLDGRVRGPAGGQESELAAYMLRLEDSGLFRQAELKQSGEGLEAGETVLLFELAMKMDDIAGPAAPPTPDGKGAAP